MATLNIQAKINFRSLVNACTTVPEMLEMEPTWEILCEFDGATISVNSIEEVINLVRAVIKREKDKVIAKAGAA
jgi:hypothetical protein